jgi:adenosine deaminase
VQAPISLCRLLERHREGAGIPIEICPTSNALTLHLPDISHHPTLTPWITHGYPFVVCTDDQGVFGITLSEEYALVARSYSLERDAVCRLAMRAFDVTFSTDAEFAAMRACALDVLSTYMSTN